MGLSRQLLKGSHLPDKTIHHLLLAGLVELDRELVAVDHDHVTVAELLVKHAVTDRELRARSGRLGNQLALDGERAGTSRAGEAAHALDGRARSRRLIPRRLVLVVLALVLLEAARSRGALLRALPAGRAVARAEMRHVVEARAAVVAAHVAEAAFGLGDLDIRLRQFIEEARGQVARPQPVRTAVGGEIDVGAPARAREPDMGEAALLLEAGAALVV